MPRTAAEVVFVDGVRTPIGRAGKMYAHVRADDLIVPCVLELMRRNPSLPGQRVGEVAIAATTQIGDQGLTIGRTVPLLAGLPITVPGYSVDRMCGGAMTAVTNLASNIATPHSSIDVAIAGGVEHMGRHPIGEGVDPNPRFLAEKIVSAAALSMPETAMNLHDRYPHLTRQASDALAAESQRRYEVARQNEQIQPDLVPISVFDPETGWSVAMSDEHPRPDTTREGLAALKSRFREGHGKVTAGNAAGLNDGATACLLASEASAAELGLNVKMRMVGFSYAGVEPEFMGEGPVPSTRQALDSAGLGIDDIGLIELNEAFGVQVLTFLDAFGIDADDPRFNPYGGAIAVGHPLASSGVRLMTQLARQFQERPDVRYGITALCIGIGMGGTVIWENPHHCDYTPSGTAEASPRRLEPSAAAHDVAGRTRANTGTVGATR